MFEDYALTLATLVVTVASLGLRQGRVHFDGLVRTDAETTWLAAPALRFSKRPCLYGLLMSVPVAVFFFFDQNISSLLCQGPTMRLAKNAYFHSPFLLVALLNAAAALFRLPFATGSLPHSPQLVRALTTATPPPESDASVNLLPGARKDRAAVLETRHAPLLVYGLILAAAAAGAPLVRAMPLAAVDGILVFVGLDGILETTLARRCVARGADPPARCFVAVQLVVLGAAWALNLSPAGLAFPAVIVALVPLREHVLPRVFSPGDLARLDADDDGS